MLTKPTPEQLDAAIEAAGRLQQRLIEAKAYWRLHANSLADTTLYNADVALETLCIAMGRRIEDREDVQV